METSEVREVMNNVNCLWKKNWWRKVYLPTSHTVQRLALSCVHSILPMKEHQLYKMTELTNHFLNTCDHVVFKVKSFNRLKT